MISNATRRSIFALAILLICANGITATVNINNICLLLTENALVANPDDCSSYYSCSNGIATPKTCTNGYYFNKNTQSCVSQAPNYCSSSSGNPCQGHAVGTFVAVSGSCSGYYYCSANGAKRSNCPNNLVFNPTTQSCAYKSSYACDDSDISTSTNANNVINMCSFIEVGKYFGNAYNCASWQKCTDDNNFITGECSSGLMFDTNNVLCNYASAVSCSQVTYDPSLDVTSAANGGPCTTNGSVKKAIACNEYYLCNGLTWTLKSCDGNLYFDTTSGKCVNRLNAHNDCDRCVSTTDTFVNTFGNDCTGYSFCSHGVQQSSGTCGSGLYFNEELQGCTDQNPEFIFCAAAAVTTTTTTTTDAPSDLPSGPSSETSDTSTAAPTSESSPTSSGGSDTSIVTASESSSVVTESTSGSSPEESSPTDETPSPETA